MGLDLCFLTRGGGDGQGGVKEGSQPDRVVPFRNIGSELELGMEVEEELLDMGD